MMFFVALYIPFFQNILRVVPLRIEDWLFLLSFGLLHLFLIELAKMFFIRKRKFVQI